MEGLPTHVVEVQRVEKVYSNTSRTKCITTQFDFKIQATKRDIAVAAESTKIKRIAEHRTTKSSLIPSDITELRK